MDGTEKDQLGLLGTGCQESDLRDAIRRPLGGLETGSQRQFCDVNRLQQVE
jgi:hypothetical protein